MQEKPYTVRIRLLGGFRVSVGSRTVGEDGWRLKKAKSLLKLLALAPGYRMHREQLAQWLWPDSSDPNSQATNLRQALHSARRTLVEEPVGAGSSSNNYLRLLDNQVVLCQEEPLWVDVEAFEEAVATAGRVREPAACRVAIDLYAGELLPEDRYEGWAEERREGLRATYLSLLLELAGICEDRGEFEGAIDALRKAVVAEPSREEAHAGLMRLYSLTGRRHEALLQYERLRQVLSEELGAEPGEAGRTLYEEIRAGRSPTSGPESGAPTAHSMARRSSGISARAEPSRSSRHNLPVERTSFVGREGALVEVGRLLSMTSLLTLTGTGGSGKTRFALALARELTEAYQDGAWLVELASLSDPELVERAVAQVLGVREQPGPSLADTLQGHPSSKELLLILDNCEHLVEASARLVETLLDSCPNLKVLATSREALNVSGELVWRVPSLPVPNGSGDPPTVEELGRFESVRLFVERARYRLPSFELTSENARAVAEVCGRLEGIPLAIELAVARVRVLSVGQIAARLKDSLGVLAEGSRTAPSRQRTLRGALDWSYELLGGLERELFGRLSVFWGGWSLEAAEVVGAEPGSGIEEEDVLDFLAKLVDKSLVVAEAGETEKELRYRMLEPVRQYGREKLQRSGEAELVRRRHAEHYLALAEQAEPYLKGHQQVAWMERLETEHDNLRAAMGWLLEKGEIETVVRLAWALRLFWNQRGHQGEGYRYAAEALEKADTLPTGMQAKALFVAAVTSFGLESIERTKQRWEESATLFRQAGDRSDLALAVGAVGLLTLLQGDVDRASKLLRESVEILREAGDKWGLSEALMYLGMVPLERGDHAQATRHFEEALTLSREIGNRHSGYISLHNLALIAEAQGDHERAVRLYVEGMRLALEISDEAHAAYCLEGVANLIGVWGEPERAARLLGASEVLLEAAGAPLYAYARDRALHERAVEELRSRLGEETFTAAWTEGRAMSPEQVVAYAPSEEGEPTIKKAPASEGPPTDGGQRPTALTPREREVAMLVARELTNRQVAEELVVSERTVATHVHKILKKLNLRSRVQIAAWAMEQELLR